jgi:hypothetical protein
MINYKPLFYLGFISLSLLACQSKTDSVAKTIVSAYLQNADSVKNMDSFIFYKNQYIATHTKTEKHDDLITGQLIGKLYGHYFILNSTGALKNYKYLLGDNSHYSYEIQKKGDEYFEVGTPFVDFWNTTDSLKDSNTNLLTFFFSTFPRSYLKVLVSSNSKDYARLEMKKSKLMPFLQEVDFVNQKGNKNLYFIIESDSLINGAQNLAFKKTFHDTLRLK